MSSVLPISDLDNPHRKRKMQHSPRYKLAGTVIALALGSLFLWGFLSPSSYGVKLLSKEKGSSVSAAKGGASSFECSKSYDGTKPVNQYVVMIDAGSSGSRVHIYNFNNCEMMPRLVNEDFKMKEPGLSKFAAAPSAAAESLDELLEFAVSKVPKDLQACSPIAVKATAGLRKLGEETSNLILAAVRSHLTEKYPFPIVDDGVAIMAGEDEGVYAWVTANYLLGNIGTSEKKPTAAVFDLGGGSTQIVFEPTFKDSTKSLVDGETKFELSFGGRDFVLYQHSYLGYGLNEAREKINLEIVTQQGRKDVYINPCLPPNTSLTVNMKVPDGSVTKEGDNMKPADVYFKGPDVYSPVHCRAVAEKILDKDAVCANPPCSFGGVHQPKLFEAFPFDSDMYVFSFFYDRTEPLGVAQAFSLDELRQLTGLVCQGERAYSAFEAKQGAIAQLKSHPQWCTELNYMDALLRTGYELKAHREVRIAKKISGNELGWCLGASLPLLDQKNWKCKQIA